MALNSWSRVGTLRSRRLTCRLSCNGISRFGAGCGFDEFLTRFRSARPNVKAAVGEIADFPAAPNALILAEAAIKNIMAAEVGLCPMALAGSRIVAAFDEKSAHVIDPVAADASARKGKPEFHPMPMAAGNVVVEPRPRSRWK